MTLIKSISGIRGTIGGKSGDSLTPLDIIKFSAAFGSWVLDNKPSKKIVIGRDARISGQMVSSLIVNTLLAMGLDVVDLGLSTTPTVEIAVPLENAGAGIIVTASHNPKQWNALKLLNEKGEFISAAEGEKVIQTAGKMDFSFAQVDDLGNYTQTEIYIQKHIDLILALSYVDVAAIKAANFKVVIDCVNSTGGIFLPILLEALGVSQITKLYCEPNGEFPHNPEPLAENLTDLSAKVQETGADLGISVDPDVDRLVFVNEDGTMFGEEYTLVAIADFILSKKKGNAVSNLSSTRALRDVTEKAGGQYAAAAVGEVNVVTKMKETNAIIGGEGNGGVILPELHYGRDALVGIALFLTHLANKGGKISDLKRSYPEYHISKNKIELHDGINVDEVLATLGNKYKDQPLNLEDGVKIEFDKQWVHLRKSNTEPIIRIYSESTSIAEADALANRIKGDINELILQ